MISKSKLVLALAVSVAPLLRAQHDMSHMGTTMQAPLATKTADEWWAGMEEVFHVD